MRKKLVLFFLSASVFLVYGLETRIEIILNGDIKVYSDVYKDLNYNEGDEVKITFSAPSLHFNKNYMKLTFNKDGKSTPLKEATGEPLSFKDILTKDYNNCDLVCDIRTQENEQKQLKVHFSKNLTESERNARNNGNLFKIVLIGLGAFIVSSILFMIIVALYNKFKRKARPNTPPDRYPIYEEAIPMSNVKEKSKQETEIKVDCSNKKNSEPNEYLDTPRKREDEVELKSRTNAY